MRRIPMLLTSILRHRRSHLLASLVLLFASVLLLPLAAQAQGPKPPTTPAEKKTVAPAKLPAEPAVTHEMTAADVEAFLDGIMPMQLQREDIAGAVVLVVKDGKVLFAKGYGYSDVAKKTPVSPDATLFRPGSVSKLFTWTAVMQLVEQGKLDLDRDVNDYLDFKVPPFEGKPITLRNIMTHTPGMEESLQELFISDPKYLVPLGDYVKTHLPARIYPPATYPAYSNYATTLAGYIVQRVSGQPFDDYIETHIFKPLQMDRATFRQPLPDNLKSLMSNGYERGSQPPKPFEVVQAAPAGSSAMTATAISHFIIAHLQDGQYEGAQILRPETARLMHSVQFKNLPDFNGMALGFYEETRNGHRIIGHAGDTGYFHSDLHLIPDAKVGFFISYNSAGKGEISGRTAVWEKLLDRYFPYDPPAAPTLATAAQDAQSVSGKYIVTRRAQTTIMNILNALGQTDVSANSDATISVKGFKDLNGQPKKFRETAPLSFREVDGQDRVGFKRDDDGRLIMAIDFPFFVFQKARWFENGSLNIFLIVFAIVIFILTLLLWPVSALIRWHYGTKLALDPAERRLRLLVRLACIAELVFLAGFIVFFMRAMDDIGMMSSRYNGWLRLIQLFGWLGIAGMLLAIFNAFRSWLAPRRWIWSKLADSVIALAFVFAVWFAVFWNMLNFSLRY